MWVSWLLLISAFLIVRVKRIHDAVLLLGFQSVLLAVLTWQYALTEDVVHLYIASVLTLVVKAVLIPGVLLYTIRKIDVKREIERYLPKTTSLLTAILLTLTACFIIGRLQLPDVNSPTGTLVSAGFSLFMIGAFIMIDHKNAIMQGIGLIVIENGLFLTSLGLLGGMPLIVEIGIFVDLLVSVIIIGILSYHINNTFKSLNTEHLKNLKG